MVDPLRARTESRWIWVIAAAAAVSLHLALGAFAIANLEQVEAMDLGAPGIEIALDLAAPRNPPSDLPPGPDSEASMATPPTLQQQEEMKESQLPKDTPLDTQEPDRLVTENTAEKPEEEKPDAKAQPAPPSEASVAREATAMPSVGTAQEAPKSVTRDPGVGRSKQRVKATWERELIAHVDKHKKYPSDRSRRNADIIVNLVLDRTGKVVSVSIAKSSGDNAFDQAALDMLRRADPVPAPPALIADDGLSFFLPVQFRPRGGS